MHKDQDLLSLYGSVLHIQIWGICTKWIELPSSHGSKVSQEENIVGEILQDALIMYLDKNGGYWVIRLGVSFHATSHKEYFINYTQGNYGQVLLGNTHPCKIFGIGNIIMKLPNIA